jgi:hypothetical protein
MIKDIKTKDTIKDIKTPDKKKHLEHFVKKSDVKEKPINNSDKPEAKDNSPKNYAINKTVNIQKSTAVSAAVRGRNLFKRKKMIKEREKENQIDISTVQQKLADRKQIKTRNNTNISVKTKNIAHQSRMKIKKSDIKPVHNHHTNYNQRMKMHIIAKHKNKVKEAKETQSKLNSSANVSVKVLKGTVSTVKKAVSGVNNIMTMGMGLIILIVITLFIGVFSALSDDSSVDTSSMYVSEEVISYTKVIEKYAKESDISDYVPLIQAVMMQESGGKGKDPMQSSECRFNEKYPKKHNGITDPDYSIKVGIQNLATCLKKASAKDPSDMDNISLALQGYNYGNGYIQWAIDHFGGYTRANAKVFSDEMKAKLQTKVYGDPLYVQHVLRYYHIGNGNIVLVAKSQIGNVGGKKYWNWYGFKSRVSWCACFVSWCANESGVLDKTIPKFASTYEGEMWFKHHDKWKSRNYIPSPGDIIFFDWEQNDGVDHVGIVEKVESGKLYTIEGNSKDEVRAKSYSLNYKSIYGYGINK